MDDNERISASNDGSAVPDIDSGDDLVIAKSGTTLSLHIDRDFLVPAILSIGAAGALVAFVILSFQHPTEATTVLPLIIGPLGAAIVSLIKRKDCKRHSENDEK